MHDKKRIFCDIDNTIFPLLETILPVYNEKYGDNLQFEQITDYDTNMFIKSSCTNFFKEFMVEDIWKTAKPYENSVEILTQLNEQHEIYFVTAGHPNTAKFRDDWLEKYFSSFYSSSQLIICRYKQLLIGDLLIDDYYANINGGSYRGLLYEQPWNKNIIKRNLRKIDKWDDNTIPLINQILGIG